MKAVYQCDCYSVRGRWTKFSTMCALIYWRNFRGTSKGYFFVSSALSSGNICFRDRLRKILEWVSNSCSQVFITLSGRPFIWNRLTWLHFRIAISKCVQQTSLAVTRASHYQDGGKCECLPRLTIVCSAESNGAVSLKLAYEITNGHVNKKHGASALQLQCFG